MAVISPPTTTEASDRCVSTPTPEDNNMGTKPKMVTLAVIITGRSRISAPLRTASRTGSPDSRSSLIKLTSTMPFSIATPNTAMKPIADGYANEVSTTRLTGPGRQNFRLAAFVTPPSESVWESFPAPVPHGFRSSFRDWASEQTDAPRGVMEAALAHKLGDAAEQAYARSDLFEKRRKLMGAWGRYVSVVSTVSS